MRHDWDAIVVGGGVSGATAALLLARLGWRCMLVERRPRHRRKTCGHCLSSAAMPLLRSMGLLEGVHSLATADLDALRVHLPHGRSIRLPLTQKDGEGGLLVDRSRLDQFLIDRAADEGASILQPATARLAAVEPAAATVDVVSGNWRLRARTRLLVIADGLRSGIARRAVGDHAHTGRKYGFSFDLAVDSAPIVAGAIDMFIMDGGYLGIVRGGADRLHVAAIVGNRSLRDPVQFCGEVAARYPAAGDVGINVDDGRMSNFTASGPMPCMPRCVAWGPAALVGDAAGYVEPFTGEGMHWAILSAAALADVASSAAPGDWCGRRADCYRRLWSDRIGRRQRLCAAIAWAVERPTLLAALARMVPGRDAMLRQVAARVNAA